MPLLKTALRPKPGLVDEIVHVALDRAVVVAEEHHPFLAVEKDPAREVDRADASQMSAPGNMPRGPIHSDQNANDSQEPDEPRLQASHRRELIRHVMVFAGR